MERRRSQVEPVRLRLVPADCGANLNDSGIDEHDCQGWRCREVGEKSLRTRSRQAVRLDSGGAGQTCAVGIWKSLFIVTFES